MNCREAHIFTTIRSRKFKRFYASRPAGCDFKLDCDPNNNPGGLCFNVPLDKWAEFEKVIANAGLTFEPGIVAVGYIDCFTVGDYCYTIANSGLAGLHVIDVSNPSSPTEVGFLGMSPVPIAISIYAGIAYVACAEGVLKAINIDNPASPTLISTFDTGSQTWTRLRITGRTIFMSGDSIAILRIKVDATPLVKIIENAGGFVGAIALQGDRIYIADAQNLGSAAKLTSWRWGGFNCEAMTVGTIAADDVSAEVFRGRHAYLKGDVVGSSISTGGASGETDTGVVSASNYFQVGNKRIGWGGGSPEGLLAWPIGSLFLSSNGDANAQVYIKNHGTVAPSWSSTGWEILFENP